MNSRESRSTMRAAANFSEIICEAARRKAESHKEGREKWGDGGQYQHSCRHLESTQWQRESPSLLRLSKTDNVPQ